MSSEALKLHRNLLVCRGDNSCGKCFDLFPELKNGDIIVPRLVSERDPAVDRMIRECPAKCLYLVVPS